MKRLKSIKIFNLIIILFVVVFSIGYAFAWFLTDAMRSEMEFNGSSASAYFAGGNGSAEHPYQIENRYHMYNLAWLQDTGRFCDADGVPEKLYFELTADFNMVDGTDVLWLPPIGNADYPFVGVFDGNGHQITNLKITTDKSKLNANNDSPLQGRPDYEFANSVGMFGATQSKSATDKCVIKNFILDNPEVEVSATNTRYSSVTATDPKAAGIAIGYVDGLASSIGVRGGTLTAQANYSTFNSILGVLADGVQSSVTGGGHGGGEGTGSTFGASFDVEGMLARLNLIDANKKSANPSRYLIEMDNQSDNPVPAAGYKIAFSANAELSSYVGASAKEVVGDNNVGYFCGNQNKVSVKQLKFVDPLLGPNPAGQYYVSESGGTYTLASDLSKRTVPRELYTERSGDWDISNYNISHDFRPITAEEKENLPDGIKELVYHNKTQDNYEVVRIQSLYNQWHQGGKVPVSNSFNAATWVYHGQISWMGNTYGRGYLEDGVLRDEKGYLVNTTIWPFDQNDYADSDDYLHKASDDSYYINYATGENLKYYADGYEKVIENGNEVIYLTNEDGSRYQMSMDWGGNNVRGMGYNALFGYAGGVIMPSNGVWFKPAVAGKFKFVMFAENEGQSFSLLELHRDGASLSNPFPNTTDIGVEVVMKHALSVNILYYFEYEVKPEDLGKYEYQILCDNSRTEQGSGNNKTGGGAYLLYLDLGANGEGDQDVSTVDPEKHVSAVDFIYTGVEIKTEKHEGETVDIGNFIISSNTPYLATRTSLYFEQLTGAIIIEFSRPSSGSDSSGHTITATVTRSSGTDELGSTVSSYSLITYS